MDKRTVAIIAGIWVAFEVVAVGLWLGLSNVFYLANFSYIGTCIALGLLLYAKRWRHARHFIQFAVGLYMLVYLGFICGENMQMEGFWFYLFNGVFAGATIHYLVAKIAGPALFGRGWCGYACWTAMVLDLLPFKTNEGDRKTWGWVRFVMLAVSLAFACWLVFARPAHTEAILFWAFIGGNALYYAAGIALAFALRDNRAFCKYICPVALLMKPAARFSLLRVKCDESSCVNCGKCGAVCPMNVDVLDPSRGRKNGTECILCLNCVESCPKKALKL